MKNKKKKTITYHSSRRTEERKTEARRTRKKNRQMTPFRKQTAIMPKRHYPHANPSFYHKQTNLFYFPLLSLHNNNTHFISPFFYTHQPKSKKQTHFTFPTQRLFLTSSPVQLHLLLSTEVAQPNCRGE